jgi:hypothetical protein
MKIENVEVYGFRASLRGMRNPMDSWANSDSTYFDPTKGMAASATKDLNEISRAQQCSEFWDHEVVSAIEWPLIGPEDMRLALSLIHGGGAHRKFLRQIMVWWDITIPRAIWQELDTYKVSTVRNSCSTMHKLGSRDLEPCDFEDCEITPEHLSFINNLAWAYRTSKKPAHLHRLKMHLPESFLQKATYSFSYETGLKMYFDRKDHRMPEWSGPEGICSWIMRLPYMTKFANAMTVAGTRG